MSRFDDLFAAAAAPILADWFGGDVEYREIDLPDSDKGLDIEFAIVGEEKKVRRRNGEYELDLVSVRTVSIITDCNACNFSGVRRPRQNATIVIIENCEKKIYDIEQVLNGAGGFHDLKLIQIKRVALGSQQSLGE